MTAPNDGFLLTPDGSGVSFPTHLVSGQEFPVSMIADPYGRLLGTERVYCATGLAMAKAASRTYLTLFNADPALIVEVWNAYVVQETTAAVTGLGRGYRLFNTTSTAPSGGTLLTPQQVCGDVTALDADITCRASSGSGVTATASGQALAAAGIYEEETGGGPGKYYLWNVMEQGVPIVLTQNQGVMIQQDATAGTGVLSAGFVFRVR